MNSNNYHFEVQVAKAANGQTNGSAEESKSLWKTVLFQFHYIQNLPLKLLKHSLQMFSSLFGQKYFKMETQLIQLKSLSFILADRITRNQISRKRNIFCLVAFTPFLPSETETDEPQCNRNKPLLAIEVLGVYLDA